MATQRSLALDGIRGLALACPIVVHLGLVGSDRGLWLAIGMFFTLSAFLVTDLALREIERTGTISISRFWLRRVRRLLPASLLVLALTVTVAVLIDWPSLSSLRGDVLSALVWGANWEQLKGSGYWDAFTPSLTNHFWSLSFEEQVYVLFPVLVGGLVLAKKRFELRNSLALTSTVMIVVSWWLLWTIDDASILYLSSFTRLGEIGFGMLAACLHHRHPTSRSLARTASLVIVAALAAATPFWIWASGTTVAGVRWGITVSTPLMALVIAMLWRHPSSLPARFFSLRVPAWLGRRSYGIYLLHLPIIEFTAFRLHQERLAWWAMLTVIGATLVAAGAMFRWFEEPLRTGRFVPSNRRVVMNLTVAAAVLAVATLPVTRSNSRLLEIDEPSAPPATAPDNSGVEGDSSTEVDDRPGVLVVGDSTAWVTGSAVEKALDPLGYDVHGVHMVGCPFGGDVRIKTSVMGGKVGIRELGEEVGCDEWWNELLPQWLESLVPDHVIVVGGYAMAWEIDPDGDDRWCRLGDGSGRCEVWAAARLKATTDRIAESSPSTTIVYTSAGHVDPWGPLDIPSESIDVLNELISAEVERAGLSLLDLGSWLDDHLDLTVDGTHLGPDGVEALTPWLARRLPPILVES